MSQDLVTLAVIGQPHGVSGRIKVKSFTDPADAFAENPALAYENGTPLKVKITGHTQGMTIVEIEGIKDRNQAELLRGRKLVAPRTSLPELKTENEYYIHDLIGLRVVGEDGSAFGIVEDVVNYGAGDILEIRDARDKLELYAFNHATFPVIDHAAGRITINPPEILDSRPPEGEQD